MNTLLVSNVALLAFAVTTLTTAVDLVKSGNYVGAGILVVISVLAFVGYEKIPPTTPTPPTPPIPPAV